MDNRQSIWDHLGVCLVVLLLGYILVFASLNLSIFNPLKHALNDFKMTDVYFEMLRSDDGQELNDDIVLVDMTRQTARDEIAQTITDINSCQPKVLMVDLLFQRPSFDQIDDVSLVSAIETGHGNEVFSCKLVDYRPEKQMFAGVVKSFFSEVGDFTWGYSNVVQVHPGGRIREYSLSQWVNDTLVYSMPYLAACRYTGEEPKAEDVTQRLIVYNDTDFPIVQCDEVTEHASLLKDKIVILGAMDEEADKHSTPLGKMSGMKVQAYSTLSYLQHHTIRSMSRATSLVLAFLICLFCAWAGWRIRKRFSSTASYALKLFYFLLAALLVWGAFICFVHFDYDVDLLYPLLGAALVEEARTQYTWLVNVLAKRKAFKFLKNSIYCK